MSGRVENLINMLEEFNYRKNGKYSTIEFLKTMIEYLEKTYEYEWEEK